ncbi:hypothetical protein HAQ04_22970 [Pseudomonas sp. C2L11]|nr:hypothetical protein [Pseudomonas typographi]
MAGKLRLNEAELKQNESSGALGPGQMLIMASVISGDLALPLRKGSGSAEVPTGTFFSQLLTGQPNQSRIASIPALGWRKILF